MDSDALIVLVLGDAAPLVEEAAAEVLGAWLPRCGLPAFNHARYRAGDAGMATLAAARTPPMMADLRLVEVRDLQDASPALLEALVEYVAAPSPTTGLLLVGSTLPKSAKGRPDFGVRLRNAVKRSGRLVVRKTGDVDLARYVARLADAHGKRMAPQDARMLVDWVGADAGRLEQEVIKLSLFVGVRDAITAADVRVGSALLAEAQIWDLTGAIAARNVDAALGAVHRLMTSGEDARRLLAMMAWQLRDVVRVAELVRRGASDADIRGEMRVRWDVVKGIRGAASPPKAADVFATLARANREMNQHRAGDRRVLEDLILRLCAA